MYKVHCLNNISQKGLALLSSDYELTDDVSEADVILVRSANMHEMEFSDNLKAVARAGAGVNNIPLDALAERGIRRVQHAGRERKRREGTRAVRSASGRARCRGGRRMVPPQRGR